MADLAPSSRKPPVDDGLAQAPACGGKLRHDRRRGLPMATTDGGGRFRAANCERGAMARLGPAVESLPVPGLGRSRWLLELIRCRAGESADFEVEACDATGRIAVPAEVAGGSSQQESGRRRTTA